MRIKKKIWMIIKWILVVIILIFLLGVVWNAICKKVDERKMQNAYGDSVQVNGKNMVVEIVGENHDGPPIILLPGLGEPSPILEFRPLASELSKKYEVITIEPFGYGLSDSTKRKRTIENIVEELHECVKNLGEEEYYLMGHSISGLYTLYWSQIYPDEIKGIIGIDPSVPQMTSKENNPFPISVQLLNQISAYTQKIANISGITRLLSMNDPAFCKELISQQMVCFLDMSLPNLLTDIGTADISAFILLFLYDFDLKTIFFLEPEKKSGISASFITKMKIFSDNN